MSWAEQGNLHLLGYVLRHSDSLRYADAVRRAAATQILVAHKNAWVRDMVDGKGVDQRTGEVLWYSIAEQRAAWDDCMRRAEAEIARLGGQRAAA